jgi:hypothetical protein
VNDFLLVGEFGPYRVYLRLADRQAADAEFVRLRRLGYLVSWIERTSR